MKLFGKILILLTINLYLIAGVEVVVNKQKIVKGQTLIFTINAIGTKVKFPQIDGVEGESIIGRTKQHYTSIINGVTLTKISQKYMLKPEKSITIPSFEVEIDGKIEKTKTIKIEVVKATQTKDPDFSLKLFTNKKEAFVGEPILLTVLFTKRINKQTVNEQYLHPQMKGFWTKILTRKQPLKKGNFLVHKIEYSIFAQKSGVLNIENAKVQLGIVKRGIDMFSMFVENVKYKNIYSNSIAIKIKPLPSGVTLFGNYTLRLNVDKKEVKENEPVNVTIEVKGEGNIDDIKEFNINIPNATVYKDKPKIETFFKDNKYQGIYTQKFAIVGDGNFEIPPFEIKFFNNNKTRVQKSKKISIKVLKTTPSNKSHIIKPAEKIVIEKPKIVIKNATHREKLQYLLFGILIGVLVVILIYLIKKSLTKSNTIESSYQKTILKSKNDKELLEILLPFVSDSKEIDLVVKKLEENLYKGFSHKINKKLLSKNIDKYIS